MALVTAPFDEILRHLLGDLQSDVLLRLGGRCAEMRGADDVRQAEERALGGGLDLEDVEACAGDVAGLEGLRKRLFIDETAAGAVDDTHARLGLRDRLRVQDVAGLVRQRHVQADEVCLGEEFVELDLDDPHFLRPLLRQERIIGDDVHLETDRAGADDRADIAGADDAEHLAGDLDTHELRLFPLAGLGRAVGSGKLAGNREHQGDRMLGGGDRVAEGRVHDDDAAARSGGNVDIVDADAGAADDLEIGRGGDQLFGHLGG